MTIIVHNLTIMMTRFVGEMLLLVRISDIEILALVVVLNVRRIDEVRIIYGWLWLIMTDHE